MESLNEEKIVSVKIIKENTINTISQEYIKIFPKLKDIQSIQSQSVYDFLVNSIKLWYFHDPPINLVNEKKAIENAFIDYNQESFYRNVAEECIKNITDEDAYDLIRLANQIEFTILEKILAIYIAKLIKEFK